VAGLQIYTTKNNLRIPFIRNQRAAVYVNEIRMDYDYLSMLPVNDIAMIKVIKGPFVGGWGGAGGAIAIYTIRGEDESTEN
jgi:outer membrane receptor for ferrienterochelin and colicin